MNIDVVIVSVDAEMKEEKFLIADEMWNNFIKVNSNISNK